MDVRPSGDVSGGLTKSIIGCAIDVHRALGPGLLESAYRACLVHELVARGLHTKCEASIPIRYQGIVLETGYRADIIVEDRVLLEVKAVERFLPIHEAQVLTYLKLSHLRVALLLNFNVTRLQLGVRRLVR